MQLGEETIIHPLLMPDIVNFYPSLANIANFTVTQDEANQPIETWIDNPILRGIPCYVQPASGEETRGRNSITEINQWLIGMNGYFPDIYQKDRIDVDGVIYDILRVAHDDHGTATYITAELVS